MSAEPLPIQSPAKPTSRVLSVTRMPGRSNERRIEWDVRVTPDTTVEDLLNPIYWNHVAGSTFRGDINYVNVHWEDKSQLAHLYVRQYTDTAAKMELLAHWDFDENDILEAPEKYDIPWSGPQTKYRVIRKADNQLVRDGFSTKPEAIAFIETLPK